VSITKKHRYHHGDLREALVQAAVSLITAEGAEGFSLRRVANLLGVSQSALYSHFRDKDDLFAAVAAVGFERLHQRLQEMLAQCPAQVPGERDIAHRRAAALVRGYVGFALAEPAMFGLMFRTPRGGLGRYPLLSAASADCLALIQSSLVRCAQPSAASGADPQQAELRAAAGWAQVHGLAELLRSQWLEPRLLPATLLDRLADLLLSTLSAPLGAPSSGHADDAGKQAGRAGDQRAADGGQVSVQTLFDQLSATASG